MLMWITNVGTAASDDANPLISAGGPRPGMPSRRRYKYGYFYIAAVLAWMR